MTESVETPPSFQESEDLAWQYFHNAFGVHAEFLYHKNNYTAIQVCHSFFGFLPSPPSHIAKLQIAPSFCTIYQNRPFGPFKAGASGNRECFGTF
jgi:hypothetical protein